MLRYVSGFAGGLPGAGLLLMRLTIGVAAMYQGVAYITEHDRLTLLAWCSCLVAIGAGTSLVLGLLTAIGSLLICLDALLLVLLKVPLPAPTLFGAAFTAVVIAVTAAALVLVGPGALSVDARLFGLRRIAIPRSSQPQL